MTLLGTFIGFLISLVVSAIIIYLAAKLFGEKEGFGTALLAALAGAFIFSLASYFITIGWIVAFIGVAAWLIALSSLYSMGILKSAVIAVMIWAFATLASIVLPTIAGPL